MLLLIEFIIVVILVLVLTTVYVDEHRTRRKRIPAGKIMGYWEGEERRRDIRIQKMLSVRYSIETKPRSKVISVTKNISKSGILMETSEKLLVETLLGLEIEIPNCKKAVAADGKVVWTKESNCPDEAGRKIFSAGINFIYIEPRGKKILHQYITSPAS